LPALLISTSAIPRRRTEDNIKIDFKGNRIWLCELDLSGSGQEQWRYYVNTAKKRGV